MVACGHLVQKLVNPTLCDTSTALDKLLYAEGEREHNYRLKTRTHFVHKIILNLSLTYDSKVLLPESTLYPCVISIG